MDKLLDLSAQLAGLYRRRAQNNFSIWQTSQDIAARRMELTPPDGWPGKNEMAREVAAEQTLAADETLQNLYRAETDERYQESQITGEIEALEAERRAEEWKIRLRLCDALDGRHVSQNGHGDRAEAAFDDALQAAADTGISVEMPALEDNYITDDQSLPF